MFAIKSTPFTPRTVNLVQKIVHKWGFKNVLQWFSIATSIKLGDLRETGYSFSPLLEKPGFKNTVSDTKIAHVITFAEWQLCHCNQLINVPTHHNKLDF